MQRREKGTGTIYQRENGTWIGRISIGRGRDGKIKHKCISGKTEAEVRRKIREYNRTECPLNPQQMLLKDYLMSWLTNIKKISLKPSSYDRLESTALKQVIPRIGTFKISEITPEDIGGMLASLKEQREKIAARLRKDQAVQSHVHTMEAALDGMSHLMQSGTRK